MKALDTNIIIRFIVNDDKKQGEKVRILFKKAEEKGTAFFLTILVLLETIWVLDSVYNYDRNDIINTIESLSMMSIIEYQNPDTVSEFILISKNSKHELEDILIGISPKEYGCDTTLTFDKKASKSRLFELLT